MKLIKASGIMDFYISRKKYNSYKKPSYQKRYVEKILKEYLYSLVLTVYNGCEIRYCDITSNNFWGNDINIINDLNYSYSNQVAKRKDDKLPIRVFQIDLIGIDLDESVEKYNDIVNDNFILTFSSVISI